MTEKARQQRLANVAAIAERRRAKTHCKRGHEFTPENTIRQKDGHRRCRICVYDSQYYTRLQKRLQKIASKV